MTDAYLIAAVVVAVIAAVVNYLFYLREARIVRELQARIERMNGRRWRF